MPGDETDGQETLRDKSTNKKYNAKTAIYTTEKTNIKKREPFAGRGGLIIKAP